VIDLTVVVPAFNEERTIEDLLRRVVAVLDEHSELVSEVIVVDDGSSDRTAQIAAAFGHPLVSLLRQDRNLGKGAAVQRGIAAARGRHIVIQDADVEYFPADIPRMIECVTSVDGCAVYGSRVLGAKEFLAGPRGRLGIWPGQGIPQWVANSVLALLFRRFFDIRVSDPLTGYKLYPATLFSDWAPTSTRFETDHEITIRLVDQSIPIVEVPIRYAPRSRAEGKKIGARDFVRAVRMIVKDGRS